MASSSFAKVGRNDACPCGSGKKYKRCCMVEQAAAYDQWAKDHEAHNRLTRELIRFATGYFWQELKQLAKTEAGQQFDPKNPQFAFETILQSAWQDFEMSDFPEPLEDHEQERQIFMPYFLFHWHPAGPPRGKRGAESVGIVTQMYREEMRDQLTEDERTYLEQATRQPLSFYEVLWSKPGERMEVRDVLIGEETEVIERLGSQTLKQGDIIYGQVWNMNGYSIFGCLAPLAIPPKWKSEVIGLRKKLRKKIVRKERELCAADLVRYAEEVRETYLDLRDTLYAPPRLVNTDGDPLAFCTVTFQVESPEAAFAALASLAVGRAKEELLAQAEFDEAGKLSKVEFDWLKKGNRKMLNWENTMLGSIKISENSIVAEVNSENRARRLREEIERRLGNDAVHKGTVVKTLEEIAKSAPSRKKTPKDEEKLLRDPEIREQFQVHLQKQVEAWVDQKIPALGGRTPREAVKDPEGREIVESLLLGWERHVDEGDPYQGVRPDITALRRILKVPRST
ncbi:MAG TPA: SEC-C metal-binding domain-containing protein [Candidatus Acidoferrum sp.]|nr:SEC-C metal-binding domain-containing protein [Candidatus Acidoferrum sp.]